MKPVDLEQLDALRADAASTALAAGTVSDLGCLFASLQRSASNARVAYMGALHTDYPAMAAELRASRIALARAARVEAAAVEMRQGADKPLPWGEWPRLLAAFDAATTTSDSHHG